MTDFRSLPDLASGALGGAVVFSNNDFYADAFNLVTPTKASHDPLLFNSRGKVYDGWETRRRRDPKRDGDTHGLADWAIIRLATPAIVRGVNIDTSFFKGNFPTHASVEGTTLLDHPTLTDLEQAEWVTLVGPSELEGDSANVFPADDVEQLVTHVRLTIYPDGGVARFRVYGEAVPDPRFLGARVDLAATIHGGRISGCSNMFYSSPANVLAPGRAAIMADGWETARRRDDGNDWLVVDLGATGVLHNVIIDTLRFVGNAPGWAQITDADTGEVLLERTSLLPDAEHRFRIRSLNPVARVRLDIYPDGGISRFRVNGEISGEEREVYGKRWLSLLPAEQAAAIEVDEFFE